MMEFLITLIYHSGTGSVRRKLELDSIGWDYSASGGGNRGCSVSAWKKPLPGLDVLGNPGIAFSTPPPTMDQNVRLYKVSISPEIASEKYSKKVLSELVKACKKTKLGNRIPAAAYDGKKSLYTAGALPFTSKEFAVKLDEDDLGIPREREFKVTLTLAAIFKAHPLIEFLCARQSESPQEAIQLLDVPVMQPAPQVNYDFYAPLERDELGSGLEYWRAYSQMDLSLNLVTLPAGHASVGEVNMIDKVNMIAKKKMYNGVKVDFWVCLNFSSLHSGFASRFSTELVNMCVGKGMNFNMGPVFPARAFSPLKIGKALADVASIASKAQKQLQLMILILPDHSESYGEIERICQTELNIIVQCCELRFIATTSMARMEYSEKVALEINAKVLAKYRSHASDSWIDLHNP